MNSRCGKFMLTNIDSTVMITLTILLLIETIVHYKHFSDDFLLITIEERAHKQYLFGIGTFPDLTTNTPRHTTEESRKYLHTCLNSLLGAIFVGYISLFLIACYRYFKNKDFEPNLRLMVLFFIFWCASCTFGGAMYAATFSEILLCFFTFGPPIMMFGVYGFSGWLKNDFRIKPENRDGLSWFQTNRVAFALSWFLILTSLMGMTMSITTSPRWFGYTVACGVIVLTFTSLGT